MFKNIGEAYNILIDKRKRANYDKLLSKNSVRCKMCSSIFQQDVELANHVKKFHANKNRNKAKGNSADQNYFNCKICSSIFRQNALL